MKSVIHDRNRADDPVSELREIIVGPEQAEIKRLARRIDDRKFLAADAAAIISEAVEIRQGQDESLSDALGPTVEKSLYKSVARDPRTLADALFPVIGPAIRRAVAAAMRGAVQNMNLTMDSWVTPQGLRWRAEAWRTGRSYAEVVLRHSVLYQIEQVLLIQRETGIVIGHVVADKSVAKDADLVSSMLTALGSFVADSFEVGESQQLETLEVGDVTICVEPGPYAALACVIRGTPPSEIRDIMQDTLADIHGRHGDDLLTLTDETTDRSTERALQSCLLAEFREEERRGISMPLIILLSIVGLLIAAWAYYSIRDNLRWSSYVQELRSLPGIVVLDDFRDDGRFVVEGLRDPLATDPTVLLADKNLSSDEVAFRWTAFQSADPALVLARARHILQPPEGVVLELAGTTLTATGVAFPEWRSDASRLARLLPGVDRLEFEHDDARISALVSKIEGMSVPFGPGGQAIGNAARRSIEKAAAYLTELGEIAESSGRRMSLTVVGHTDPSGSAERNVDLSLNRARIVAALLEEMSAISTDASLVIAVEGMGSSTPIRNANDAIDADASRRVTFEFR